MTVLSVAVLKTLFSILTCVMAVALAYGFVMDYFLSCFDPKARWMQVGLLDFCIDASFIAAWFFYKESRWILRVPFIFGLLLCGSVVTCGYIVLEFFKLSVEESLKDPLYYVLVRRKKWDASGDTWRISAVTTRVIIVSLGCLMLGILFFVLVIDGSPFRSQVLSPCMITLLTDLCIHAVVFSVWITYKESSWTSAFFWILLVVCFGSISMCAYIVRELSNVSSEEPVVLVLFNKRSRDSMLSDPLLMEHGDI